MVKLDTAEEYYVIDQSEAGAGSGEPMEDQEEEQASVQNDSSQDLDNSRGYAKKPQKYRKQWEEHPALKSEHCCRGRGGDGGGVP